MRLSPVPFAIIVSALALAAMLGMSAKSYDFRAFYCAGTSVREHANPYAEQPLHDCEQTTGVDPAFRIQQRNATLPAPFPGYVLAAFAVMSFLPFGIADRLWTLLLAAAVVITVAALVRMTAASMTTTIAACMLSLGFASVLLGELVPVCVAALCLAALFAQRERWNAAALAAVATLVEPHIGLPVVLALAIWKPRARVPLALGVAALALISVAGIGFTQNLEYVTRVLPAHALSEVAADSQLSASVIAAALGASPKAAVALGSATYLIACAAGIVLGRLLARRFGTAAFVVATPAAMAVFGGAFIHVAEFAAAIPFVVLLLRRSVGYRPVLVAVLCLLAVPWRMIGNPFLEVMAGAVVFALVWENAGHRAALASIAAAGALTLVIALNARGTPPIYRPLAAATEVHLDPRFAEARWAQYNTDYQSSGSAITWWQRVPSWLGLLLLVAASLKMRKAPA